MKLKTNLVFNPETISTEFVDKIPLYYEAWYKGKNPDVVSEEAYDMMLERGFYPDEITLRDIYPPERNK